MSSLTSKVNEDILVANGYDLQKEKNSWKFRWTYFYKDPRNKGTSRPMVDVSAPYNPSDERHAARKHGVQMSAFLFTSLSHFAGVHNEAPYTTSYSSFDCCAVGYFLSLVYAFEGFAQKAAQASFVIDNPRTSFAHRIVLGSRVARAHVCWLVGCVGYFYSYELLYTFAPGFKIADPSCNGWHQGYRDGNTTFRARLAAAAFPTAAHLFWNGNPRFALTYYGLYSFISLWYEMLRVTVFTSQKGYITGKAADEMKHFAQYGDLQPDMHHRNDADSNRPERASMYRYMRHGDGTMSEMMQNMNALEERPMVRTLYLLPNPYFNWQKAKQGYAEKPYRVKNDLWELPSVLSARVRSGEMDVHPAY